MRKPFCFDILISSPSDVQAERDIAEKICNEWNSTYGEEKNIRLETKRWENNLNIDSRKKTQNLINQQLVAKCDVLFAIFGKRFGTPTDNYESGTIEEIEQIVDTGKPYFIYFMKHQYLIDELDAAQIEKVKSFKNKLKLNGSFKEISDHDTFKKEFFSDITYHVNLLMNSANPIETSSTTTTTTIPYVSKDVVIEKTNWYELSISELINEFLEENNQQFAIYKRGITFIENYNLWKSISEVNYSALVTLAKSAREYAFNTKYGNYDYSKDLRSKYPNWHSPILEIITQKNLLENLNVIGIASNYGEELEQIFHQNKFKNVKMDVLDLSNDAISRGKKVYHDISFYKGDMEESPLKNSQYDVYLNLRSIHSSGVDFKPTLTDCYRILKPGGLAIISVSNGYLTPKKPSSDEYFEVLGLYDNRTESFSKHRPLELARKIWSKLIDYGFKNASITSGKTEIFISAQK